MAVSVVDLLEMIDIDQKQGEEPVLAPFLQGLLGFENECLAVENIGQNIPLGLFEKTLIAPSKRAEFALQVNMRNCKTDDDKRKRTDDGSIEILDEELVCVIRIPEKEFKNHDECKESEDYRRKTDLGTPVKPSLLQLSKHIQLRRRMGAGRNMTGTETSKQGAFGRKTRAESAHRSSNDRATPSPCPHHADSAPGRGVTLFFDHGLAAVTGRRLSPGPWV
jgi:hypothetical protein